MKTIQLIYDCIINLTYELIEDTVNLNWLESKSLHVKRLNVTMERLVLEMAYFQLPLNEIDFMINGKVCKIKFSIKTRALAN